MNIQPNYNRVLIKPDSREQKGTIIIPDTSPDAPTKGTVVASGDQLLDGMISPSPFQPGDSVIFVKFSPDKVKIEGTEYYFVRSEDILGKINDC